MCEAAPYESCRSYYGRQYSTPNPEGRAYRKTPHPGRDPYCSLCGTYHPLGGCAA